jgi:hypothetical protein
MVRYKLGLHNDGINHRILGLYHRDEDIIELHPDDIAAHAKENGDDPQDLEALVLLHEEGHRTLNDVMVTEWQEEQLADDYAFWNFFKRERRLPMVNLTAWRST